jgi:hypothetical protein
VDVVAGRTLDLSVGVSAGRLREVPLEDGEALDLLDAREAPVDLVDVGLEQRLRPFVARQCHRVAGRAERAATAGRPEGGRRPISMPAAGTESMSLTPR